MRPERGGVKVSDAVAPVPPELQAEAAPLSLSSSADLLIEFDLRGRACVNIDFRNTAQTAIPLHLSLRRDARAIIANRWSPKGWRRELVIPADLRRAVHLLDLRFRRVPGAGVTLNLALDGQCLAHLDRFPRGDRTGRFALRRGFPGLADLGWITWPEGMLSLRHLDATAPTALLLSPRLEVMLQTECPNPVLLLAEQGEERVFTALQTAPARTGARWSAALLPGRIWRARPDAALQLIARDARGDEIARRTLRRVDILTVLQDPATEWSLRHDPLARLQMLEHVHFAGIWSELPQALQAPLQREGERHRAAGFAPPPNAAPPPAQVPQAASASLACDAFHRAMGASTPPDPEALFRSVATAAPLDPAQLAQLGLLLSEWFCLNADPHKLHALCAQHGVTKWTVPSQPWAQSAVLPMLWVERDWQAALKCLQALARAHDVWIVTPSLGWFARALAQTPQGAAAPDTNARLALVHALLDVVVAKAEAPMSQISCTALIAGLLDLLEAAPLLPDQAQQRLQDLMLRAYGLCPEFWSSWDGRGAQARCAALQPWCEAFGQLQRACLDRNWTEIPSRAQPFLSRPIAGNDRLRRLVLSAQALPCDATGLPDLQALTGLAAPEQIDEAALRWLASPRSAAGRAALPLTPDSRLHQAACNGLRRAASQVPRPRFARAHVRLGQGYRNAFDLLRRGDPVDAGQIDALMAEARALSDADADHVGLPVLLALTELLSRHGSTALAQRSMAAACEALTLDATAPAIKLAAARFDAFGKDPGLRQQLRAHLPADPALAPPPQQDPLAAVARAQADPLADTVVALISCHAHLQSRVPAIMAAWGDGLAALGVPIITVVGRGPYHAPGSGARFDGHLLELDAPDDYEGLPQKTLALADWVLTRTGFGRVFKIDDDCFLDAEAFFNDPVFLNIPYFGRPLQRSPGEMDRSWHMGRAQSDRGRFEFDKSPEPALYADGGSGYVLNRQALGALVAQRATASGRALEAVSFMEDKLVGDLLAQAGITVAGPNYDLAVFRKSALGLPPLPQYHNGFLPFAGARIKLAHLDGGGDPQAARAALASPWPSPMKIWPLQVPAGLGWARHALDLISPPERLAEVAEAELAVVSVMRNERFILEHFLAHYRRLGVRGFLIVDNGSDDGTLEHLGQQPDVAVFSTDTPYRLSAYGVMWQEALLAQYRLGRWSLVADADEFLLWSLPDSDGRVQGDLPALLRGADFAGAEAVRLAMLDLYPQGPLSQAGFTRGPFLEADHIDRAPLCRDWQGRGPWSNAPTVTSALRHRLMTAAGVPARANLFVAQKYALLRYHPFMRLATGLHYIAGARVAARELAFAHFKYHAEFHAKARAEAARGQHFNNAEEYRSYIALQAEGRDVLYDPAISVQLQDCPDLRALCAGHDGATVTPFAGRMVEQGAGSARRQVACASRVSAV